ncbi:DUF4393 domain-containing protein [Skermania piniformis]|uniref:DUF4393 domain-containing protein n=3 Tax=Skermania pinensis TaxID=39122 RepID=A0ABX8S9A1_9ACTN|nr:Abi-alpha family protein [Skermania piniformis]QXQ14440.1 DUF4393 domain-containing protein [Skermania piniformis]
MTDETIDPSEPAGDDSLWRAARIARDAAGNATVAASLVRSVGADLWRALSVLGNAPLDATESVVQRVPGTDSASQLMTDGVRTVKQLVVPVLGGDDDDTDQPEPAPGASETAELRASGAALIAASHRPDDQAGGVHRAFARILDELVPDEARIVRFLAVAGPQPSIDVRTKSLFQIGSRRLVSGVSLVAEMAGCREGERDRYYLANLHRLGLVTFSAEPVDDFRRYALLEVQEEALHVLETTKSISVYRSICLSAFGLEFAAVCFDTAGYDAGGWQTYNRGDKMIGKGPPGRYDSGTSTDSTGA